jgi:hypothetical protein
VIGLGFLSGVWTAVGINPQEILLGLVKNSTELVFPDTGVRFLFIAIPTIILVISIIMAYRRGKVTGLFSVVLAYISGLGILTSLWPSLILLGGAVLIGILATSR